MSTIRFEPHGVVAAFESAETVLDVARRSGVPIYATCSGGGRCGRCRVRVAHGTAPPPTERERVRLSTDELRAGWRLACQSVPIAPVAVEVPHINFDGLFKSALGATETLASVSLKPAVTRVRLQLERPTLEDNRPDGVRLRDALMGGDLHCRHQHMQALRQLPRALRQEDGRLEVWLRDDEVIAVYPHGAAPASLYGLAYDIGTTTVAAYLVDLTDGSLAGVSSAGNNQAEYGGDVMTRIDEAGKGRLSLLQERVVAVMNGLAARLGEETGVAPANVIDVTVVGNTTMTHLLLGVSPTHLGIAPYTPVFRGPVTVPATSIGLALHPVADVTVLPNVAGFVGADAVAAVLATAIDRADETMLLLDIGTNAEMVLGSRHGLIACATAAGPAFEGACITHGMRAAPGAIDHVVWARDGLQIRTIDNARPRGLAGSGLVSAAATLRRAGLLDHNGLLDRARLASAAWYVRDEGEGAIVLASTKETGTRFPIVITEGDLSQLQLARAALATGLEVLLEEGGVDAGAISAVLLAGAFGNYMDHDDAGVIGLFPPSLRSRARGVGNAAGAGAVRALVNVDERTRAERIASSIRYVELSGREDFNRRFVSRLPFPRLAEAAAEEGADG